ncbi:MAG: hypothetical protein J6M60_01035 [Clostridia bacterium]|nr:hypothetical protein [Clostridia bacterium]
MEDKKKKSGMGVAALVLGIISIVSALFWYISIPTGILGIVFGAKSAKKIGSKLGKAGLATGIVGISLCVFNYINMIMIIAIANAL